MHMEIETGIAPPPERGREVRVTDAVRAMKPGDSFVCDEATAKSFRQFGYYHGWGTRQQTLRDGVLRVWRIS